MKIVKKTPVGLFEIEEEAGFIVGAGWVKGALKVNTRECESPILTEAFKQLDAYFAGTLKDFDLPIKTHGTPFQEKVWRVLAKISYGKTLSYAQTAAKAGNPKAARAVGGACNKNPIAIIIPCHRVVGANGALTGFASGVDIKGFLLNLEKI